MTELARFVLALDLAVLVLLIVYWEGRHDREEAQWTIEPWVVHRWERSGRWERP